MNTPETIETIQEPTGTGRLFNAMMSAPTIPRINWKKSAEYVGTIKDQIENGEINMRTTSILIFSDPQLRGAIGDAVVQAFETIIQLAKDKALTLESNHGATERVIEILHNI